MKRRKAYKKRPHTGRKGVFAAKFTGKAPCWVCKHPVEKGSFAKFDFSTGQKLVIHETCEPITDGPLGVLPDFPPSHEQRDICDAVIRHARDTTQPSASPYLRMCVEALAGTGKTSTIDLCLNMIALEAIYPGDKPFAQYLVFSSDMAAEAQMKISPRIAMTSTVHSFGFSRVKAHFKGEMSRRSCPDKLMYLYLDYIENFKDLEYGSKECSRSIARMVKMRKLIEKAKNLCIRPGDEFLEKIVTIAAQFDILLPSEDRDRTFYSDCQRLFQLSVDDTSRCDYDDMVYFLWYYDIPITLPLHVKVIAIDEFQDQNPLRIWLTEQFAMQDVHLMIVGDSYQAIMGFTGAMTNAMEMGARVLGRHGAHVEHFPLTINRRTHNTHIIDYVREQYIPELKAHPGATHGLPVQTHDASKFEAVLSSLHEGDAVLGRTNAPNISMYLKLLSKGVGATILGRENYDQIMQLFEKLATSHQCQCAADFTQASFEWEEASLEHVRTQTAKIFITDQAESVRSICSGLQGWETLDAVRALVNRMFSHASAGNRASIVTLASAHKSKGLEWDRVFLMTTVDGKTMFPHPKVENEDLKKQEYNLLYGVGCLRARYELHLFHGVFEEN